jgi:phosphate-starvation-inducible protein E
MAHPLSSESGSSGKHEKPSIAEFLEHGDGWAHILVAVLLLLLALAVLVDSTITVVHDWTIPTHDEKGHFLSFVDIGLRYLSDILFGVIILELLSTILTYIKARSLEATIKEFLIVGLISSIRKILLIGAQSSLNTGSPDEFVKEALGTILSIIGILLLIGGLLLLDYRIKTKAAPPG